MAKAIPGARTNRQSQSDQPLVDFQLALRDAIANVIVFSQRAADLIGLNPTDLMVICVLETHGPTSAGELGRRLGLSSAAVTAAIDRVERLGYARRVSDPTDRRRVLVELEAERVQLEVTGPTAVRAGVASPEFVGHYSDAQLRTITDFLRRLSAGMGSAADGAPAS
jgi:DNA-binding MarR family transcriptional regulator